MKPPPAACCRSCFTVLSDPTIDHVRVQGGSESEREAAQRRFEQFSGSTVGPHDLVVPVDEVYSLGRLDLVKTHVLRESDGSNTLLVTLVAPAGSRSSIRIGMRYVGMISSSAHSRMVVTQNLTVNDITGRGSYWTSSLGFVNTLAFSTAYFQPLVSNLYLQPRLSYAAYSDSYSEFGPIGTVIEYQDASAGLELGLLLSRYGELRGGLEESPGTLSAHPVIVLDGGAVDSWLSYPEAIDDVTANWTSSVGLGVRFSDSFAALLRVGILRELQPFIALNLGAFGL